MDDGPEARLARWTERDAAIGLVAEVEQLRATIVERDREIANLRERCAQLGQRVAGLEVERNGLAGAVSRAQRPSIARRLYRRARRLAARALPR
jgi:cell division protein FtsB